MNDLESADACDDYSPLERDVVTFATALTRDVDVDDELADRLLRALGERRLVELAFTVGLANLTNRVAKALRVELP